MAMPELTALDNAYQALQPLGQAARRRALQWLTDALVHGHTLPDTPAAPDTTPPETTAPETTGPAAGPVIFVAPARRRKAAVATTKPTPATSSSARRGRRIKGSTSQATVNGERPYRRMPDPDAIMKAYRKVGTVSGLADRFEVPRHTVNHWARRLRSQGYDIGRTN
jgi:hypothetical protein